MADEVLDELNELPEDTPETQAPKEDMVPRSEFNKLYKRAKTAEEELKKFKVTEPKEAPKSDFDIEDIVDLRQQGFNREETERIKAYARARNMSLSDAAKDPFVQAGITGLRGGQKAEDATPAPGRPAPVPSSDGKDWSKMSREERSQAFSSQIQRFKKGRPSNE